MKKASYGLLILLTFSYLYNANCKDMSNIQEEIWKDVVGYEGYYQVRSDGLIIRPSGILYPMVILQKKGNKHGLLVPFVNHIDGNKLNNDVAKKYNISQTLVCNILNLKAWQ
jgi:hypothetical protein